MKKEKNKSTDYKKLHVVQLNSLPRMSGFPKISDLVLCTDYCSTYLLRLLSQPCKLCVTWENALNALDLDLCISKYKTDYVQTELVSFFSSNLIVSFNISPLLVQFIYQTPQTNQLNWQIISTKEINSLTSSSILKHKGLGNVSFKHIGKCGPT